MKYLLLSLLFLVGCSSEVFFYKEDKQEKEVVVKGNAVISIDNKNVGLYKVNRSVNINYNNAASTTFTIDSTNMILNFINEDVLSLGSISVVALSDNNLKDCSGYKCNNAAIRIYTIGSMSGFVHTTDGYSVPLYINMNTIGLNSIGAINVQEYTIPINKNKIRLTDFPNPIYNIYSDFSNAGDGNYSVTIVIEYILY